MFLKNFFFFIIFLFDSFRKGNNAAKKAAIGDLFKRGEFYTNAVSSKPRSHKRRESTYLSRMSLVALKVVSRS